MIDVEKVATELSKQYSIPTQKLQFNTYHEPSRSQDITQIFFRTQHPREKFGAEIAQQQGSGVPDDIMERQIDDIMRQLEEAFLENSGRVTFYKGQPFFWRRVHPQDSNNAALEVECTTCGWELETVAEADEMRDSRDLYLMWLLYRASGNCKCDDTKYEPVNANNATNIRVPEGTRFTRVQPKDLNRGST